MKQLILIEGLPGTGKTSTAHKLFAHLTSQGEDASVFFEDDERIPSNFYEKAGVPRKEYRSFRTQHPHVGDAQCAVVADTNNFIFVRLDRCSDQVAAAFRRWNMGDEFNQQLSVSEYTFCALEYLEHWVSAQRDHHDTIIMDSAFLQNPINELIFRKASDDEIRSFILSMAERLRPLNPLCLYLKRQSAAVAIAFAKRAKGPKWSARIDALLDAGGCPDMFARRFELELSLLPHVTHVVCSIEDDDWSDVDRQIESCF